MSLLDHLHVAILGSVVQRRAQPLVSLIYVLRLSEDGVPQPLLHLAQVALPGVGQEVLVSGRHLDGGEAGLARDGVAIAAHCPHLINILRTGSERGRS